MQTDHWTASEKKAARAAYEAALQRELGALLAEFKKRAASAEDMGAVWALNEWLGQQGREIDEIYDYRYSRLIFAFATMIRRGVLDRSELAGLSEDKIGEIKYLSEHIR